jgi:CRP-like cAMP-binding protein
MSPVLRARVAEVGRHKAYARGELIFAEGDPSDAFIVIVSGRVKVFKSTPAGKEVILEIFGAGDPLGAVAVYEGAPFMASAFTLEPTQILRIEQSAFFRLLEQDRRSSAGCYRGSRSAWPSSRAGWRSSRARVWKHASPGSS